MASAQVPSCYKLLDWVELEYRDFTRTDFIKRFTSVPERDDPRYNDSGFVLLNQHLGMGNTFDNLGFKTRTNRKTSEITPGLDAQDPFANFLIEIARNPGAYAEINSTLVETVEKMYMMKYMNERWNDLKSGLDEALRMRINRFNVRTTDSKLLLDPAVKKTLVSIIQGKEDFLKKDALVHAANRKDLDELLKPALSYGNLPLWRANDAVDLREQLIDIYTTYGGLVRTGFAIHAKNPKIKEFHEE